MESYAYSWANVTRQCYALVDLRETVASAIRALALEVGPASCGTKQSSVMTLAHERRRKRSLDPLIALHYQLSDAEASHLDAIVVADDSGIVVAGVGAWAVCEELAAYAPLLAEDTDGATRGLVSSPDDGSRVAELRREVDVQSVTVDGQRVLLCSRRTPARVADNDAVARMAVMTRAAEGVARILRTAA